MSEYLTAATRGDLPRLNAGKRRRRSAWDVWLGDRTRWHGHDDDDDPPPCPAGVRPRGPAPGDGNAEVLAAA